MKETMITLIKKLLKCLLTDTDYEVQIRNWIKQIIIQRKEDVQHQAELAAQAEMESYLRQRYNVAAIFPPPEPIETHLLLCIWLTSSFIICTLILREMLFLSLGLSVITPPKTGSKAVAKGIFHRICRRNPTRGRRRGNRKPVIEFGSNPEIFGTLLIIF